MSDLRSMIAGIDKALTDEDEIAHGEAWSPDKGGLGVCAYCDGDWPCRTQQGIDRLRDRLREYLALAPAASDGSLDAERLARAIHKTSGAMTKFETETEYFARWAEDIATEYARLSESASEGKTE